MKRYSRFTPTLVLVIATTPFIQGSSCIDFKPVADSIERSVERINQTMSQAVETLGEQSASWQGTLTKLEADLATDAGNLEKQIAQDASNLEKQIVSDVRDLITQIDVVVKDGVQFGQETFNCQTDIFATHARIALKNILNGFLNKYNYKKISNRPKEPYVPIVCSANPNGVNVAKWDLGTYLVLSGTDLNLFETQKPSVVVVRANSSEFTVPNVGNRVTNYRFEINVPAMIGQNLLKDAVQLQVRWNGQKVNQNEIPVVSCGGFGKPCCRGNICESGSCVSGVCGACGSIGQACCNGGTCGSGSCVNNVCTACGGLRQACCTGNTCSAGSCVSGICTACGGIGQPCCNGTCSSGGCVRNMCAACGGAGQPCCNGTTCNLGNKCMGGSCTPDLPACVWTASFSEEGVAEQHCPSGFAMRGAKCTGDYCDNMSLYCCPYRTSTDSSATKSWSVEFSEEAGQPFPISSASSFASGLRCRGKYCDNLKVELLRTPRLQFIGQCYQGPWFSEEGTNHQECPDGQWVSGMACKGKYCDSVSLFCCRGQPVY